MVTKALYSKDSGGFTDLVPVELYLNLWYSWSKHFESSGAILKWFMSHLSKISCSILINLIMWNMTGLSCDIPQGSVLSSILFLLYILSLSPVITTWCLHLCKQNWTTQFLWELGVFKLSDWLNCLSDIKKLQKIHVQLHRTVWLLIATASMVPQIKPQMGHLVSAVQSSLRNSWPICVSWHSFQTADFILPFLSSWDIFQKEE